MMRLEGSQIQDRFHWPYPGALSSYEKQCEITKNQAWILGNKLSCEDNVSSIIFSISPEFLF